MSETMEPMDQFDMSPEALEASIAEMDQTNIDEFSSGMDYDRFIVLDKKELNQFCALVEPLTKSSIDEYGKSVLIRSVSDTVVELSYMNTPYNVRMNVSNKSNKQIKTFAMTVANLKKITTNAYASIVFVEQSNEISLALCESLLYLETKPLKAEQYNLERKETSNIIDKEIAQYTFKRIGSILACTDRASEKVIVIKDKLAHFNTGAFTAKSKSPFSGDEKFLLFKQVSDIVGLLSEYTKVFLRYSVVDNLVVINCDDNIYCEMPTSTGDKVNEFLSPAAENLLNFKADISVMNDSFLRLLSIVKSLEYLSEIVTVSFTDDKMKLVIASTDHSKQSVYEFDILEGKPQIKGDMKITVDIFITFLKIVGDNVKYAFTENGLGIKNDFGDFLIRKSA